MTDPDKTLADLRWCSEEVSRLQARVAELEALYEPHRIRQEEMAKHSMFCPLQWNTSADCDCGQDLTGESG